MALESLWWVEGDALAVMQAVAAGEADITASDRDHWRWRAMIVQLPPIDEDAIRRGVAAAGAKRDLPSLSALRYERWTEGGVRRKSCTSGRTRRSRRASSRCTARSPTTGHAPVATITSSTSATRARPRPRSSVRSCASPSNPTPGTGA